MKFVYTKAIEIKEWRIAEVPVKIVLNDCKELSLTIFFLIVLTYNEDTLSSNVNI